MALQTNIFHYLYWTTVGIRTLSLLLSLYLSPSLSCWHSSADSLQPWVPTVSSLPLVHVFSHCMLHGEAVRSPQTQKQTHSRLHLLGNTLLESQSTWLNQRPTKSSIMEQCPANGTGVIRGGCLSNARLTLQSLIVTNEHNTSCDHTQRWTLTKCLRFNKVVQNKTNGNISKSGYMLDNFQIWTKFKNFGSKDNFSQF